MKSSLWELTTELSNLEQALEQAETDPTVLYAMIQSKVDSCADYLDNLEMLEERVAKRIKEFQEAKKRIQNEQDRFKDYVMACIDKLGVKQLQGETATFKKLAPSKSVVIEDLDALPPHLTREKVTIEADKIAIKELLLSGEEIPGAKLQSKERLGVRIK